MEVHDQMSKRILLVAILSVGLAGWVVGLNALSSPNREWFACLDEVYGAINPLEDGPQFPQCEHIRP